MQVQPCFARWRSHSIRSSWASCSRPGPPLPRRCGEVAAEVLLQPGTDLGAERLVLLAVGQIHDDTVAYQALVWFSTGSTAEPAGAPMSVPPQQRPGTLPGVLRAAAERYGDRPAYVEGDRTLSFTELLEQVRAVARGYVALGLEPGDRVVVWAPNSIDWVVAGLAVSYAGGDPRAGEQPLHRARGGRHRRPHRRESRRWSRTASSTAPRSPTCREPATSPRCSRWSTSPASTG